MEELAQLATALAQEIQDNMLACCGLILATVFLIVLYEYIGDAGGGGKRGRR